MKTKSSAKVALLSIFIMSVITAVTLNSCQKERVSPKVATKSKINRFPSAAQIFDEANNMIFSSSKSQKGFFSNIYGMDSSGCVTFTLDTVSKPHTATYTYTSGCVESDGQMRSGTVIFSCDNQDIRVTNNVFQITYQNYYSDSLLYNGTMTMTNTGVNGNGNIVLVENGNFTVSQGGQSATVSGNYNYEWIAGESSSPLANLQFKITGGLSLTFDASDSTVSTYTTPVVKNCKTSGCNYKISGVQQVTYYSASGSTIETDNYGTPGGCSGQYTLTSNGVSSIQNQ